MSIINVDVLKQFLEKQYARHLVFKTDNVEILLVCWLPGQDAEVHDHGQSDAITLILDGQMAHTTIYPDGLKVSGVLNPGDIEHIPVGVQHRVMNNTNDKLVTLHIYSPPIDEKLLDKSVGYANRIKLQEVKLLEKTISYFMAEKTSGKALIEPKSTGDSSPVFAQSNSKRKTVAIIGGGFSGTLVATQLMRQYKASTPLQVVLIERAPKFARGFAYSTNSPMHFLNVPAGKMSAFPDAPEHFLKWAKDRDPSVQADSFMPRMLYGEYLESVLHEADASKSSNVKFKRLNDEAVLLKTLSDNSGAVIHLESGMQMPVNSIVLAVGNYPPRNPHVLQSAFYASDRYVRDPWSLSATSRISQDDPVLMIGTGLTMIDKAVELRCRGHRGKIYAISRHGLIPAMHNLSAGKVKVDFEFECEVTVRALFKSVREKVQAAKMHGGDWHSVIDSLRPHVQKLWSSLSFEEKDRFFRHVRPYWDIHRHRIPPKIAQIVNSMIESGQLNIYAGRVRNYKEKEDGVEVTIKERHSGNISSIQVAKVVNCTGSELDFCQIQDPLIVNLLNQGLIAPDKLSLGLDADDSGALKDKHGYISKILYTLGPPLKGQLWETTAVPEIRGQAQKLADSIIKSINLTDVKSVNEIDELASQLNYSI